MSLNVTECLNVLNNFRAGKYTATLYDILFIIIIIIIVINTIFILQCLNMTIMLFSGIKCPELHVPVNGALVCDKLSFGVFCVPSCQQGLTRLLPADILQTPFEYACASNGKWTPHPTVGDCASEYRQQH